MGVCISLFLFILHPLSNKKLMIFLIAVLSCKVQSSIAISIDSISINLNLQQHLSDVELPP